MTNIPRFDNPFKVGDYVILDRSENNHVLVVQRIDGNSLWTRAVEHDYSPTPMHWDGFVRLEDVILSWRRRAEDLGKAWNAGVAAELHCSIEGGYRERKRKDLEQLI